MSAWLRIIGIGEDGLDGPDRARARVGRRCRGLDRRRAPPRHGRRTGRRKGHLGKSVEGDGRARIETLRGQRVTVLASGDPMAYGIGVTLMRRFAADEIVCLPGVGAFTLACARLGWPLAECELITVHGRPLDLVRQYLVPGNRLLVLSEDGTTPSALAALLSESGFGPSDMTVLSHMGGDDEARVVTTAAKGFTDTVRDLNTIAIEVKPEPGTALLPRTPGLPDHAFRHDGQMTKREVRAATLAALGPVPGGLLWDVGAGCGVGCHRMDARRRPGTRCRHRT